MISIIVPIYNSEKWLERCIKSLIGQTYRNIEIILINDGSKDKSLEICRKYASNDSRIIVIDKANEGVSATRNAGIRTARGEFIQFVDSDDYIEPEMCAKLRNAIENSDLAVCGLKVWQNGVLLREPHLETEELKIREDINSYFKLRKINLGPCNKLYRKDKITEYFNENLSLGEDTLFVFGYMKNITSISILADCLYDVVLDNENSLNHSSKVDKIDLLVEQRKTEETFLTGIYGQDCNLTQMYNCYLLLLHSWCLQVAEEKNINMKQKILPYVTNSFLQEKIRKSQPDRLDYKVFKRLYKGKNIGFLCLFFKTKTIIYKIK